MQWNFKSSYFNQKQNKNRSGRSAGTSKCSIFKFHGTKEKNVKTIGNSLINQEFNRQQEPLSTSQHALLYKHKI